MFTFLDLIGRAQGGQALENFASAFGVRRGDMEALTRTLLPVFQIGLERSFRGPQAASKAADLLDPKTFGAAFEDAHAALSPGATEAGRMALERIFGSPDAARVVADQVSAISGVGADVVSKVMPSFAATLLGGIGASLKDTPAGEVLRTWSGGVDPSEEPLQAMLAPWQGAMKAFMKGYADGPAKPTKASDDPMDAFTRMFEAGVELSEQNRQRFEQLLSGFGKSG